MSIILRRIGLSGIYVGVLACAGTTTDDDGAGDSMGSGESTTLAMSTTAPTTAPAEGSSGDDSSDGGEASSGDPSAPGESSDGGSTGEDDADSSGSETAGEVEWNEDFVRVADFLRANCASCHATGVNGNLLLPNPDIGNDEVRLALEGVVATTGLLLVEPGDRNASQTYLQITNEFGAQFEVEDTDRFGAWIDAGAPYLAK